VTVAVRGVALAVAFAAAFAGCTAGSPRFTSRPGPTSATEELRLEGMASYYADEFHGRPTANGETYDMHDLTAAHRTLPFNTRVRVTNLANNKSVVVRINDRGPFVGDRIIDLSLRAAQELSMIGPGTARVTLEILPQ
jgi:rare lipoprotein A